MNQRQISLAENVFLEPAKIDLTKIKQIISSLHCSNIDYVDLYFQAISAESWYLEDNIVKSGELFKSKGVGIRTISQDKSSLIFSEDLSKNGLSQAISSAKDLAKTAEFTSNYFNKIIKSGSSFPASKIYPTSLAYSWYDQQNPLISLADQTKVNLLSHMNNYAKSLDPRVDQVMGSLSGTYEIILIANSEGNYVADVRPLIRLNIRVIVKEQDRLEQGSAGGGGRIDNYQVFIDHNFALAEQYTQQAVAVALKNLNAIAAPAGKLPLVLGPGWPGILLHEAVGHGLEGDAIRKESSVFTHKLGQKVASSLCTIGDNGTLKHQRGTLNFDDEGTPTQNTTLIKDGILINYLQDRLNAKLTNQQPTGNGRRESYAYLPLPRMTNTYMLPGKSDPAAIISSVSKGIYAVNFAGGQVDITSGKFVFETSEAYLIENGKITLPVKGANLIGDGLEVLQKVVMVGNDLKLDPGIGTCGKEGQSVPVSVGQPTVLVEELTIGGTNVAC